MATDVAVTDELSPPPDLVFTTKPKEAATAEGAQDDFIGFVLDGRRIVARKPPESALVLIARAAASRATHADKIDATFRFLDLALGDDDREHIYARMEDANDPLSHDPEQIFNVVIKLAERWTGEPVNRAARRRKR